MRAALERVFNQLIREPLLLREASRLAATYTDAQRTRIAMLARAARNRHLAALELRREEMRGTAIALEREAASLALTAWCVARGVDLLDETPSATTPWQHLDSLIEDTKVPDALDRTRTLLSTPDPLAPERIDEKDATALRDDAATVVEWLLSRVEPRSPRQLVAARWTRVGIVVLLALLSVVFLVTWAWSPRNLARDRPVTASSRHPGTPDPSGVVDGSRRGNYSVHTRRENPPWVEVDLEGAYQLTRIVVVNRGDGYVDEVLPLVLQVSLDRHHWEAVAERHQRFTQAHPWEVTLSARARYVRVTKPDEGYIALSEIEVYGHR